MDIQAEGMNRLQNLRAMRAFIDREIEKEVAGVLLPVGSDSVIEKAARLYGVTPADMLSGGRTAQVVKARQAAAWLLRGMGISTPHIARALGYADHTTVLHACQKINASPTIRALLTGLEVAPCHT